MRYKYPVLNPKDSYRHADPVVTEAYSAKMNKTFSWTLFSATIFIPAIVTSNLQITIEVTPATEVKTGVPEVRCHGGGSISSDERLSKMEMKIQEQEKKLERFETSANEDREIIHQLKTRVEMLEAFEAGNVTKINKKPLRRQKRPARLLPAHALYGKPKNTSDDDTVQNEFYGPPTNCFDLGKLGYTLNGYYLVRGSDETNKRKIKIVFCRFKQLLSREILRFETLIGDAYLRTRSVHFYVQRLSFLRKDGTIPFNMARLNVGGAMNLSTGVFRAPVKGIYHFEFSALKDKDDSSNSYVHLYQNDKMIGSSYAMQGIYPGHSGISASLRLKAGDTISLKKASGGLNDHQDAGFPLQFTHFTGWLLEEELELN